MAPPVYSTQLWASDGSDLVGDYQLFIAPVGFRTVIKWMTVVYKTATNPNVFGVRLLFNGPPSGDILLMQGSYNTSSIFESQFVISEQDIVLNEDDIVNLHIDTGDGLGSIQTMACGFLLRAP